MKKTFLKYLRFPLRPRIRLTSYCNRHCSYCFAESYLTRAKPTTELALDEVNTVLQACVDEGIPMVAWQGGEPLLHSDLKAIAALHRDYGISAMIFTNGIVPREKLACLEGITASVLINYNAPETYTISESTLLEENIDFLKSLLGSERVALGITVINSAMDTTFFGKAIQKLGIQETRIDLARTPPNSAMPTNFAYTARTFPKLRETVIMAHKAGAKRVHFDCPFPLCQLSQQDREFAWEHFYDGMKYGRCQSGLDISAGLSVSSCFCSSPFENIPLGAFDGLWHAWVFIRALEDNLRWKQISTTRCRDCDLWVAHVCQGGCLGYKAATGQPVDASLLSAYLNTKQAENERDLALAYRQLFTGNYDESLTLLDHMADSNSDGEISLLQALNYSNLGLLEDAEALFCNAIQESPFPAVIGLTAGGILHSQNSLSGAIRVLTLSLDQNHPAPRECYRLHHGLAALYLQSGETRLAKQHIKSAVDLAPTGWLQ